MAVTGFGIDSLGLLAKSLYPFGNPAKWINGSFAFRANIASIYSVILLFAYFGFFMGFISPPSEKQLEKEGMHAQFIQLHRLIGMMIILILIHYLLSGIGSDNPINSSSLATNSFYSRALNNAVGLSFIAFVVVMGATHISYMGKRFIHDISKG
ncbi:MAG: hypothetical protein U1E13_10450 [Methylophilaceae bacterium]|nr:hypothetical protein [Methylophilaceae bacterium]